MMIAASSYKLMLTKLKQQVAALHRKENQTRSQLRQALQKVKKLNKTHKIQLAKNNKESKKQIAAAEMAAYAKIVTDVERRMQKKSASNRLTKVKVTQRA
jgi:hypothetical protein